MERNRVSINDIKDLAFEGYIWLSDKEKPEVLQNEKPEVLQNEKVKLPTDLNPFIVEGQLYNKENDLSYSIKFVDGETIVNEYKLTADDISNGDNELVIFESNRMDGKKLSFLRCWERIPDDNCMGMPVLTLTKNIFIGFKKKEDK